ncbi:hypothetical protein Baya_6370 [Bagarius yarrelli]|uniref:Uncharacterized protein n=1 Tax=Bagarius yarrelli TaxID=175774 RepID=A0A556TY39_BAGYA|nr:hypothetical protein Baya_6370 [Bagarius yarrelli]
MSSSVPVFVSCENVLRKETGDKSSPHRPLHVTFKSPHVSSVRQKASSMTECHSPAATGGKNDERDERKYRKGIRQSQQGIKAAMRQSRRKSNATALTFLSVSTADARQTCRLQAQRNSGSPSSLSLVHTQHPELQHTRY